MSAILSADDLNDFISPGVACIKPFEASGSGEVEIQTDERGKPLEISKIDGKQAALAPAQISLSDCLACSGCITSAEEVLVAQHSHQELLKALDDRDNGVVDKVFVASVSHQSRASIATAYNLSVEEVDRLLIDLLVNQMGFTYVVGTALGRKLSLLYESQHLIDRKSTQSKGPVLSSICPGWVLYAEKTHPYVLPYVSTTKSPQQITGCVLKSVVSREAGVARKDIYHLAIMPCFDKKLESARPEKSDSGDADSGVADSGGAEATDSDVDCVLTAKELITLLEERQKYLLFPPNFQDIIKSSVPVANLYNQVAPRDWHFGELAWTNDSGSASGGYGYNYLLMMKTHLILSEPDHYHEDGFAMKTVAGKNLDVYELHLTYNGTSMASSAVVNGFRNIQNLVRKLKPGANPVVKSNPLVARRRARLNKTESTELADPVKCDYVEIMACPNGCINGGGQITPPSDIDNKEWIQKCLQNYWSVPVYSVSPTSSVTLAFLMAWCREFCREYGITEKRLFNTWFHEVDHEKDANLFTAKW